MIPGPQNAITDVDGLKVGHAQDAALKSGVTVLTADAPFTASVAVLGGAPGTRETALLAPDKSVAQVDALVLSGGSAYGLAGCARRGADTRSGLPLFQSCPVRSSLICWPVGITAGPTTPTRRWGGRRSRPRRTKPALAVSGQAPGPRLLR